MSRLTAVVLVSFTLLLSALGLVTSFTRSRLMGVSNYNSRGLHHGSLPSPSRIVVFGTESNESNPDEEKEEPQREISTAMKDRLRRELISQGADPNYSAGPILGNPILLISFVIGFLVVVGGNGYFY
eukprot:gene14369-30592_t